MPTTPLRVHACLTSLITAAAATLLAAPAHADTVFTTTSPANGPFGYIGFDVYTNQSVAARFIPTAAYTLDRVAIWFMSNDFNGTTPQTVTITLRTDTNPGTGFTSIPSDVVLESWTMNVPVVGWNPALINFNSTVHPALAASTKYWVVAESQVPAGNDPIWVWAGQGNKFTANTDGPGTPWESGSGAAVAFTITGTPGTPPCAADVGIAGGGPGHDGALDNNDFIAFITYFFAQNPIADMGVAGGLPGSDGLWDNNDFIAFITHFFNGCP